MKSVVLHFLFIFLASDIYCNDVLSKFHQNVFKFKDVRLELISYNKSYFNFFEIKAFKYNRTTTAHNFTLNFKVDVDDKLEILMQMYKLLSNEYRRFPVRLQVNLIKSFEENVLGFQTIKNCGNATTVYFKKDITYYFCNFVPDETHLPPLIPNGQFKTDIRWLYLDLEIATMYFYHEIYIPIYPKA